VVRQTGCGSSRRPVQSAVSKLERRTDIYVSTLQDFVKATAGELKVIARFPQGIVEITQFEVVKKSEED
jgi:hypothetical protein